MSFPAPPAEARAFVRLLADDLPWHLIQALQQGDAQPEALGAALSQPVDLVRTTLAQLATLDIVGSRVSDADPAQVYYQLHVQQLRALSQHLLTALHPALTLAEPIPSALPKLSQRPRVLFLCTANSARSQLAEGLLRRLGKGTVDAFSAGVSPTTVHPLALALLDEYGISTSTIRAKHVAEFQRQRFDYVVTVCDHARETCPTFPEAERQLHWSFPDPTVLTDPEAQWYAFKRISTELSQRIRYLLIFIERDQRAVRVEVTL